MESTMRYKKYFHGKQITNWFIRNKSYLNVSLKYFEY